ncbi:nucleotidyl transferase AbiEii/AbiGii toxin family protein [Streptomyces sp. NPDC014684]|uniref:nucleotidyl transferase AbiEii/AbiGii toxin family protein n=1 Tax=Streptomyces sp. NPDC014684 TaxID=3364880 RepID=UPI0036FF8D8D
MSLSHLHRRLLTDILDIGTPYPLVITGGYAVQAHGLVDRLSQDVDVATENPAPISEIVHAVSEGLTERGWQVEEIEIGALSGRLLTTDPGTGEQCEVDVLKEVLWNPPQSSELGLVLSLDDMIGTKVRALADRGAVRDLIDVHAASRHRSKAELENLGRRHARYEFSLEDLHDRLAGAEWWDDQDYADYGLQPDEIDALRTWALGWATDIAGRLQSEEDPDDF